MPIFSLSLESISCSKPLYIGWSYRVWSISSVRNKRQFHIESDTQISEGRWVKDKSFDGFIAELNYVIISLQIKWNNTTFGSKQEGHHLWISGRSDWRAIPLVKSVIMAYIFISCAHNKNFTVSYQYHLCKLWRSEVLRWSLAEPQK